MKYSLRIVCALILLMLLSCRVLYGSTCIDLRARGADNTGQEDVSAILQQAINELSLDGGGSVFIPAGIYRLRYTVFIPSHIKIYGKARKTIIRANISLAEGRCAFLVGDSYEVNYQVVNKMRDAHIRGWPVNPDFKDIKLVDGLSLQSSDPRIKTRNSSIQNLTIEFDYSQCGNNWGGYGIQFSNAADCSARNIRTINACQAIGIGSDTDPSTPACTHIYCTNIHVLKPDSVHTYYAIGFISNSNHCGFRNADSYHPCTSGSSDGSLIGLNFVKNCILKNIKGVVGRSQTSEGILLDNAYGCTLSNLVISQAKKGIALTYTDRALLSLNLKDANVLRHIKISGSETGISLFSKNSRFSHIKLKNCTGSLQFNSNATGNVFSGFMPYLKNMKPSEKEWFTAQNTFLK